MPRAVRFFLWMRIGIVCSGRVGGCSCGNLVEAVGYPDITGAALLLREAKLQKTGYAPLPEPKTLTEAEMTKEETDATRVRVEGKLLGVHSEQHVPVLEMQSGAHLYLARLPQGEYRQSSLRTGSKLALQGVYVGHGHNLHPGAEAESFELLLNSFGDLVVLSAATVVDAATVAHHRGAVDGWLDVRRRVDHAIAASCRPAHQPASARNPGTRAGGAPARAGSRAFAHCP